ESFEVWAGQYFHQTEPTLFVANSSPMGQETPADTVQFFLRELGIFQQKGALAGSEPGFAAAYGVAPVDLGEDGRMDIAVLERRVNLNEPNGEGTSQAARLSFFRTDFDEQTFSEEPEFERTLDFVGGTALASGDFNCDGWPDLVIAYSEEASVGPDASGALTVIYGPNYGTASERVIDSDVNASAGDIVVADLDADGVPEIAVPQWEPGAVKIYSPR
ncbi:MAG: VCBS repeat-containing protein, partial [Myxococcota bacterium]